MDDEGLERLAAVMDCGGCGLHGLTYNNRGQFICGRCLCETVPTGADIATALAEGWRNSLQEAADAARNAAPNFYDAYYAMLMATDAEQPEKDADNG